jgi:hypothetical protein
VLTLEEVSEALRVGHERRDFEVKGPGRSDNGDFLANVAREMLALGNLRDGGNLVIGIHDDHLTEMLPGLADEDLATWLDFDNLSRRLAVYMSPAVHFEVGAITLPSNVSVAVIEVREFADLPHLCAKAFQIQGERNEILHKGGLYVRTRTAPETSQIADATEMRELLDLATEKALRRYVGAATRAGLLLTAQTPPDTDEEQFQGQRERAWQ